VSIADPLATTRTCPVEGSGRLRCSSRQQTLCLTGWLATHFGTPTSRSVRCATGFTSTNFDPQWPRRLSPDAQLAPFAVSSIAPRTGSAPPHTRAAADALDGHACLTFIAFRHAHRHAATASPPCRRKAPRCPSGTPDAALYRHQQPAAVSQLEVDPKTGATPLAAAVNVDMDLAIGTRAGAWASPRSTADHRNLWQGAGFLLATKDGDLINVDTGNVLYASLSDTPRTWYTNLPDGRTTFSNGRSAASPTAPPRARRSGAFRCRPRGARSRRRPAAA
jgi:hypothetical protein